MIKSEKEYGAIVEKIEELLINPENIDNPYAKGYVELNLLFDLVADYEETFHQIKSYPILSFVHRKKELTIKHSQSLSG